MIKTAFITPRQVGKTQHGIYHFLVDPQNTLYVTFNKRSIPDYLQKNYPNGCKSIRQTNHHKALRSYKYKRAILDEYLFFEPKHRGELHLELEAAGVQEVIILSTPSRMYSKFLFDFVKYNKNLYPSVHQLMDELKKNYSNDYVRIEYEELAVQDEVSDLFNNYLTDSDCRIVDSDECMKSGAFLTHLHEQRLSDKSYMNSVNIDSEVYGKYLKEFSPKSPDQK